MGLAARAQIRHGSRNYTKLGHIHPKKCGGRTVIPVQEAERWLRDLPDFVPTPQPEQD